MTCAQDIFYVKIMIEYMGLKVELNMLLETENKGAVGVNDNVLAGGRTKHIQVREHFPREIKEDRNIEVR